MKIKKKICFVATSEATIHAFFLNHIKELSKYYDITIITNINDINSLTQYHIQARIKHLKFSRKIDLLSDLYCLYKLIILFHQNNFLSVHSVTPKAGLLSMLAALITKTPYKIHTFTGQVWSNKKGVVRILLKEIDKLISKLASFIIVDSPSQFKFLLKEKVVRQENAFVFGNGSISGVDLKKFKPNLKIKYLIRRKLNIPCEAIVFIYLGRLNLDKGVLDLAKSFAQISNKKCFLLIVGPDEADLIKKINFINKNKHEQIRFVPFTLQPEKYLATADVLVLPSYREGFGSVIIEAAAMKIPSIASNIYGISDAIINKETGYLHSPNKIHEIKKYINTFIKNPYLINEFGNAARINVVKKFDSRIITEYWKNFYLKNII